VLHVVDESMAVLGTTPPMRVALAYTEQDNSLQFSVKCPQAIRPDVLDAGENSIAATILRNFSSDLVIDGDTLRLTVNAV
jgi:polar amino acid transport system substrate-binding protein